MVAAANSSCISTLSSNITTCISNTLAALGGPNTMLCEEFFMY